MEMLRDCYFHRDVDMFLHQLDYYFHRDVDMFQELENLFRKLGVEDPVAEARIFAALGDGVILHYWMVGKQYPLQEVRDLIIRKYVE